MRRTCPISGTRCERRSATSKQTLPQGVQGPFFNDEFGDTYALIFALTSDGFSHRELRDYAERVRAELLSVPDVAKIDLLGTQDEKIYLEFSTQQLAAMGLDISELIQTLQAQNAIQPSGTVDSDAEKIAIRVSGQFTSEESLKAINFRFNGRFFRLSDIAKVQRGYADPQQPIFRYNGRDAIGLAVSMRKNGDVLGVRRAPQRAPRQGDGRSAGRHRIPPGGQPAGGR